MTPSGIEPATFRFVTQHLNHCATAVSLFEICNIQNAQNHKPCHTPVSAYEMRTPAQGLTHLPELFYMHHDNRSAENVRLYVTAQNTDPRRSVLSSCVRMP